MQYKQTLLKLFLILAPFAVFSQTTYLPQGAKENILLERMEIKLGTDSILNFSKTKPFSRLMMIPRLGRLDSSQLTKVDQYNLYTAMLSNLEYASGSRTKYLSKRPILKSLYETPGNFYEKNLENFYIAVNPVFQYTIGKEKDNSDHLFTNTRGVAVRGRIANKVGFAAYVTDNQERDPLYVQQFITERNAVPGAGFYKTFKAKGGVDYFDARGYVTFGVAKVIDIAFGYDKNFIGNGHRSLFLSDFSAPTVFLKLNTHIWKFNYQNLFMELNSASRLNADQLLPKKYAAMHHLDINILKWLNVGLFEGIVFGRKDHFEFGYLNPVIFYRSIEQQNGSYDNAVAGLDLKANVAHTLQFYGQLLVDEFKLNEVKAGNGWWGNKFGMQAGVKYIDALGIKNLDLQLETNRVRPFTYSHRDSVANYTHYNQPLAHPLGANFQEWIGIARYNPIPKLMLQAKAIYYVQGKDTSAVSYGSNIFLPNVSPYRTKEYGFEIGSGLRTKTALANLLVSYELKPNFFIEANGLYRKQSIAASNVSAPNTFVFSAGIRWNMHRREFDF
ncbi:MAG: hypothetical protein JWP88_1635 [Flaviaesturariibacter sp.]|nr:hypothetical protein [Flaviaesturariibacter sp.]